MRELTDDGQDTTGDASVDEAVRSLERLERVPVHQHADVIDDVHRALQDRLADEPVAAGEPSAELVAGDTTPSPATPGDVAPGHVTPSRPSDGSEG